MINKEKMGILKRMFVLASVMGLMSTGVLRAADAAEERAKPTAQSTKGTMYLPYRAIDGQQGEKSYAWASKPYGGGTKDDPKDLWWMLEMPKKIRVVGVKIVANTQKWIPLQKHLLIQWRDGETWKTAGEVTNAVSNTVTITWSEPIETSTLRVFASGRELSQLTMIEFIPILADGGAKTVPEILGLTPAQINTPYPGPEFPKAADAGLPVFKYLGVVLDYKGLKYKPHNDIIFPSVVRTDKFQKPLGKYYMYYAPHSGPGGICLAYADALEGPWKEYEANPVISKDWKPNYEVGHVSSPDIVWIEEEKKYFLYFHGENDTTRFASTTDGLHFTYEGVSFTDKVFNGEVGQASYARVYRYTIPGKDNRYIVIFMGDHHGKARKVFFGTSKDGRTWDIRKEPLVAPPQDTCQIAGNCYFTWKGRHYITYHAHWTSNMGMEDLLVSEVDPSFTESKYVGELFDHTEAGPWNVAMSNPYMIEENGKLYMFVNIGPRLNNKIALAIAPAESSK